MVIMNASISLAISSDIFRSLPVEAQEALIAALRGDTAPPPSSEVRPAPDDVLDIQTDLSPAQFKQFIDGCSDKSKAALKAMVEGPTSTFKVASVAKAAGCAPTELTGVWSGLTKRVRTVTGDRKAYLWRWGTAEVDSNDRYIDQDGAVSETTYRSGRRVFGL